MECIYAILDNLEAHRATDVLLFNVAHPRWEFVFQPKYAAYLNRIEAWWKILRSLALNGRRFETWAEIEQAVERATAYCRDRAQSFSTLIPLASRGPRRREPVHAGSPAPEA